MFPPGIPVSKRLFDLTLTLIGLVLISPVLIILMVLVWIIQGRPIFFRQTRPGYHGKPFRLYKYRTMLEARDESGKLLSDTKRITKFGYFLRSTSLDELPELFNVVRGEMSLVGPRAELFQFICEYIGSPLEDQSAEEERNNALKKNNLDK